MKISPKRRKKTVYYIIFQSTKIHKKESEKNMINQIIGYYLIIKLCSSNPHWTLYIHSSSCVTLCLPESSLNHESLHNHIKMNIENVSKMCDFQTHCIVFKVYSEVHTSVLPALKDKCSAFIIFWWLLHLLWMRTQSSFPARHCSKWQC